MRIFVWLNLVVLICLFQCINFKAVLENILVVCYQPPGQSKEIMHEVGFAKPFCFMYLIKSTWHWHLRGWMDSLSMVVYLRLEAPFFLPSYPIFTKRDWVPFWKSLCHCWYLFRNLSFSFYHSSSHLTPEIRKIWKESSIDVHNCKVVWKSG